MQFSIKKIRILDINGILYWCTLLSERLKAILNRVGLPIICAKLNIKMDFEDKTCVFVFKDAVKPYFCYRRHALCWTATLSRLFYLF